MAILANRSKITNRSIEFTRFLLVSLKRFLLLPLILSALYLFISAPTKIATMSLEIEGYVISKGLVVYEVIFKQINLISNKIIYLQNLAKENIELKLEVTKLRNEQQSIYSLQAENEELRKLLKVTKEEQYNCISARLLSVSLNPFSKTALITAGSKHGIEIDQIVTNSEGLIGRVIQTSSNYSKILLVNDINSRIPVTTALSREKGILTGHDSDAQIIYLPKNHSIQKGEKVITSGYGNIYPSGITVGYVKNVAEGSIRVKQIVNLSKTEFVNILIAVD